MLYGYFATDAQRTELWQTAYLLYHELAESGNYTPDKLAATAHWDEDICHYWIEHVRGKLALLRQFMSGDFSLEDFSQNIPIDLGCEYFNLPPKPGGEPVIVIPAITAEMSFEVDEPESDSITETQMDETNDDKDDTDASGKAEQMPLF